MSNISVHSPQNPKNWKNHIWTFYCKPPETFVNIIHKKVNIVTVVVS